MVCDVPKRYYICSNWVTNFWWFWFSIKIGVFFADWSVKWWNIWPCHSNQVTNLDFIDDFYPGVECLDVLSVGFSMIGMYQIVIAGFLRPYVSWVDHRNIYRLLHCIVWLSFSMRIEDKMSRHKSQLHYKKKSGLEYSAGMNPHPPDAEIAFMENRHTWISQCTWTEIHQIKVWLKSLSIWMVNGHSASLQCRNKLGIHNMNPKSILSFMC